MKQFVFEKSLNGMDKYFKSIPHIRSIIKCYLACESMEFKTDMADEYREADALYKNFLLFKSFLNEEEKQYIDYVMHHHIPKVMVDLDMLFTHWYLLVYNPMHLFVDEIDIKAIGKSIQSARETKGMDLDVKTSDQLIEETHISSGDADKERSITAGTATVLMSENDIQAQYYDLIFENLNGLAYVRSKSPINSAIIDCLTTFYNLFPRSEKVKCFQQLVVKNKEIFAQIISESTFAFREKLQETAGKKGDNYKFIIEESRPYSEETHTTIISPKSLYQPLYVLKNPDGSVKNHLEKAFLDRLNTENCVDWFWENGTELMRINFGISYNGGMNTFQPDFLVRFNNNSIGIFDTKAMSDRVEDTKLKAEALYQYINKTNSTRGQFEPKVVGGIVIKVNSQFYVFNHSEYHDYSSDQTGWENLNDYLFKIEQEIEVAERTKKYLDSMK